MSPYPVLILQYAKHPQQQTIVMTTGTTTHRVLARLEVLAELVAGLREDGEIVVDVCLMILSGGVPIPINIFRY